MSNFWRVRALSHLSGTSPLPPRRDFAYKGSFGSAGCGLSAAIPNNESAKYLGIGYSGPYAMELSSAVKYGVLERTGPKKIKPTDLAKKILRPQNQMMK